MSSDTGYQLTLNANGSFQAYVGSGGTFGTPIVVNAGATTTNGPFYVAMTYDGTNLTLYVNPAASGAGRLSAATCTSRGRPLYTKATSGELRIGAGASSGSPGDSSAARFRTSRYTAGHSASTRSSTTSRPACAVCRPTRVGRPMAVTWPSRAISLARAPCL